MDEWLNMVLVICNDVWLTTEMEVAMTMVMEVAMTMVIEVAIMHG